ncbi:MAG: hypothetical protein IPL84_00805 [Chitinophagaceae bacterium]|nr:hypothetical protein [Chitinophagaceae bacterium]
MAYNYTSDQLKKIRSKTNETFFYNVLGTLLPILLSFIPICLFSLFGKMSSFVENGTICICSASFYTISWYLYNEHSGSINTVIDKRLKNYGIVLILFSAAVYCFIYAVDTLKIINLPLNLCIVWLFSLILFALSLLSLYRSINLGSLQNPPKSDPRDENQTQVNNIMSQLQ